MNLTSTIKLEQVEKEIEENQRFMTKWIDDYEYKVRRLENFINILDNTRNQNVTKLERKQNQYSYWRYHGKIIRLIVLISLSALQVI